jgi:RNA polymerase sigma-70 factor (ECF subfamily)
MSIRTKTRKPADLPARHDSARDRFDEVILPHLDAAYRLARWRLRNEHDAEDVVQESALRAFRYFAAYGGGNARAWFLTIVTNVCRDWCGRRAPIADDPFDEELHSPAFSPQTPETLLLHADALDSVAEALRNLPEHFREILVLRELEGLSYQELADVIDIPVGTVMSRLSRARRALSAALALDPVLTT